MATSPSESNLMRTTNLALATTLIMEGFTPTLVRVDGEHVKEGHPQGAWVFNGTETLMNLVEDFNTGEALVEPSGFQSLLNSTRRSMFKFLGIGQ